MLGAELQLALKFFEDFLEITVARPASQSVSVRHVRAAKIGATSHQNASVDFAVSGPTNENPSDRREGFCCLCVRKDQSTAKHSVIRLHLLQGPAAKH
jgi:hypothetical protein